MDDSVRRQFFLDNLRALAITFVVALHAASYTGFDRLPSYPLLESLLGAVAVPLFFAVDGYLLVTRQLAKPRFVSASYLRRSARRLLLPWAVFSLLYLVARALFEYTGLLPGHVVLGRGPADIAQSLYASEIASQLYFLPALFLVRAAAVWLLLPLGRGPRTPLLLAAAAYTGLFVASKGVLVNLFSYGDQSLHGKDPFLHALWGLQFFLAGMVIARFWKPILDAWKKVAGAALGSGVILLLAQASTLFDATAVFALLLGLFALFAGFTHRRGRATGMGGYTMEIYLLHSPVVIKAVALIVATFVGRELPAFLLVTTATIGLSWALGAAARRVDLAAPLFGRGPVVRA